MARFQAVKLLQEGLKIWYGLSLTLVRKILQSPVNSGTVSSIKIHPFFCGRDTINGYLRDPEPKTVVCLESDADLEDPTPSLISTGGQTEFDSWESSRGLMASLGGNPDITFFGRVSAPAVKLGGGEPA